MQPDVPNLRHLSAFREVARHGGISAAAGKVHLSQPAITQAIAKLEDFLGLNLFERMPSGMALTASGEVFFNRCSRLLDTLETGVDVALGTTRRRRSDATIIARQMTVAQLRALVALSEARNFSLAARVANLSQPSIHRAARDLERLVGVTLFKSSASGISLTDAALHLVLYVKLAQAEFRQAQQEIAAQQGREATRLVIGTMPLARSQIMPEAIDRILRRHPRLQIRTIDGPYPELLRRLREGDCDFLIGALRQPAPAQDVEEEALFSDQLAVIVRKDHPLSRFHELSLSDTLEFPWVAPPCETPGGKYLFETLGIEKLPETPVKLVSSSLILLRGVLARGDYVTIISEHQVAEELARGFLVKLPIPLENHIRPIGLTRRINWQPTTRQAEFIEILRAVARSVDASYAETE